MMRSIAGWLFEERKSAVDCALLLEKATAGAEFSDAVMSVLDRHIGVDHFSVFVKSPARATQLLTAGNPQRDGLAMAIAHIYTARHCQWDEVPSGRNDAKSQGGLIVCSRRADEVQNARYRFECYDRHGIAERLTVGYGEAGAWRLLHLYRHSQSPSFNDEDVEQALRAAACILPVLPFCRSRPPATRQRLAIFRGRLRDLPVRLSGREVEVCARALLGMTVAGTALDLGLAPTSVATYRKRAYQKLNISSQAELYALLP